LKNFRDRMLDSSTRRASTIVLALDIQGPYSERKERAMRVLDATGEGIAAVKVNQHLLLPFGLEGIRDLIQSCRKLGLPLIADLKLNDVESTNLSVVESLLDHEFDAVIANPFVGRREGLEKVLDKMHAGGGGVVFLVYMSHSGASEGYSMILEGGQPVYRVFAERARDWGADGVVVSAKDVRKISETRSIIGDSCLIFSPGIGAQGGKIERGDGKGADFLIVGRAITEAQDPAVALRRLNSG